MKEFKKLLLKFLDDEEVKEKIAKITSQNGCEEKIKNLEEEKMRLLEILENLKSKFFQKEEDLKKETEKLKREMKTLENEKRELLKELEKYKIFKREVEVYEIYESLEESVKDAIKNIISSPIEKFLYQGAVEKKLLDLWDYIEINLREERDMKRLIEIFEFFFEKLQYSYPYEKYIPLNETFEPTKMITLSKNAGEVKEVILHGIKNKITGKIIKKAVVKV